MRGGVEMRENSGTKKPGVRSDKPPEISRRLFCKIGGAGLLTGAAIVSGAGVLLFSKNANAQTRDVGGKTLSVVELDRTLRDLDRETENKYERREHQANESNGHTYQNIAIVPHKVSVLVSLNKKTSERSVGVTADGLAAPIGVAIDEFASLVQAATDQPLKRVKIVLERGTFEQGGKEIEYTNGYILPVDGDGKVTSHLGNGEYLMYGVSQFGSTVRGNSAIVSEPSSNPTLDVA
jgi:hypothetical protein